MNYKAVIFDLDGTLVDSLADLADATNYVLARLGFAQHCVEEYRMMVGGGTRKLISSALPADRQELVDATLTSMKQRYEEICLDKTRIYDGITDMLDALAEFGIRMSILTNKDQEFAQYIVDNFFAADEFELVIGGRHGNPAKPDRQQTLEILKKMDIDPGQCLFVGDSGIDMDTAASAGIKSVGVTWGFRDRTELTEHNADFIIDRPCQLLEIIR